jgi:hypothetical protein
VILRGFRFIVKKLQKKCVEGKITLMAVQMGGNGEGPLIEGGKEGMRMEGEL